MLQKSFGRILLVTTLCTQLICSTSLTHAQNNSQNPTQSYAWEQNQQILSLGFKDQIYPQLKGVQYTVTIYKNLPPDSVIEELNNNPEADLIQIDAANGVSANNISDANQAPSIEVKNIQKELSKNWWLKHKQGLRNTFALIRFVFSTGSTYLGLVTFSNFGTSAIMAGALISGAAALMFMYKTIELNKWITAKPFWGYKIMKSMIINLVYLGTLKFGINATEFLLPGSSVVFDQAYILKEINTVLLGALTGVFTQGAWGLWNAQTLENHLKAIDKNLSPEEQEYQKEVVELKTNFASFINSIVNNSLSTITATGGGDVVRVISTIISATGIIAFLKSYPRSSSLKCNKLLLAH